MLLIRYNQYKTRQVRELRSDSHFYAWVFDNHIDVFRFHQGRFERLVIVQEQREGSKCLFFRGEWREVVVE
jgi:hypothetical protein